MPRTADLRPVRLEPYAPGPDDLPLIERAHAKPRQPPRAPRATRAGRPAAHDLSAWPVGALVAPGDDSARVRAIATRRGFVVAMIRRGVLYRLA